MENVQDYSAANLKVHPRNTEFFDDISGKEYENFRDSIKDEGILTPLIVAGDMTLLSRHQRLKAAQEIGIRTVPVIIRQEVQDEDDKLRLLLVANFGRTYDSDEKKRKVAVEYVKLRGLKNGHKLCDNRKALTQDDIAKELGVSVRTLNEMLAIERKLTPEVKELLDTGAFTKTAASKILVKLSEEDQAELLSRFGERISKGVTQNQLDDYVKQINTLKEARNDLELKIEELESQLDSVASDDELEDLRKQKESLDEKYRKQYERSQAYIKEIEIRDKEIKELKEREPEVIEKVVEMPAPETETVTKLKRQVRELENQLMDAKIEVNRATTIVPELGFADFRVRVYDEAARLQFPLEQLNEAVIRRNDIIRGIKPYFSAVLLDLEGR